MIRLPVSAVAAAALLAGCTSINASPASFEGTRWQVSAINGHPAPAGASIAFVRGGFTAELGCNTARGLYRVVPPDVLDLDGFMTTERGCSDVLPIGIALATYEEWARLVLTRPMRMTWHSDRRLTLSNGAGSLRLELADRTPA